jgi:hypothetical protein
MKAAQKSKTKRSSNRLYHSAKISSYQFKKVVWRFVLDDPANEAARHVKLSTNSISAIYTKLRRFFFELDLFRDLYAGRDPRDGIFVEGYHDVEHLILAFHLKRVADKRGQLNSGMDEPDYHFAESNWRFDFHVMMTERGDGPVQAMMYRNLLEFIQRFGPVGATPAPSPERRAQARALATEQFNRMILWLERNSVKFRDADDRAELRSLRGND